LSDNRGAEFEASIQREAQGRSRSRNLKILRRLVPFMAPYRGMVALATLFLLAAAGASLAIPAAVREMIDVPHAAAGDDRHANGIRNLSRQLDVIALARAIAIHGRKQDLTGTKRLDLLSIGNRVDPGRMTPSMCEDLEATGRHPPGVDGHDYELRSEFLGRLAHDLAPLHRRRVDRDLVGTGQKQRAHVLECPHATTNSQRHETDIGRPANDVEDKAALLVAGRDVQEAQFVGSGSIIGARSLHRVPGVAQVLEPHALDHPAILDV
jgi:hypothetical protein